MKNTTVRRSYIGNLIDIIGAAVATSSAVQNRRQPHSADLRTLGIDPASFPDATRL